MPTRKTLFLQDFPCETTVPGPAGNPVTSIRPEVSATIALVRLGHARSRPSNRITGPFPGAGTRSYQNCKDGNLTSAQSWKYTMTMLIWEHDTTRMMNTRKRKPKR